MPVGVEQEQVRKTVEERIKRDNEEMLLRRGSKSEEAGGDPEVATLDMEVKQEPPVSYFHEQQDVKMGPPGGKMGPPGGKMVPSGGKKKARCGTCQGCVSPNCKICKFCADMKSNGGPGKLR